MKKISAKEPSCFISQIKLTRRVNLSQFFLFWVMQVVKSEMHMYDADVV